MREPTPSPALRIEEVPTRFRTSLGSILDQSFTGIYRWHAKRTLRSVRWVRMAVRGDVRVGLTMLAMIGQRSGYVYYAAVAPSSRARGIGGLLLDDALQVLGAKGAREIFACVRADNEPSLRLLQSRAFLRTDFRERIRARGLMNAAILWIRMVVAPGEQVFVRVLPKGSRHG